MPDKKVISLGSRVTLRDYPGEDYYLVRIDMILNAAVYQGLVKHDRDRRQELLDQVYLSPIEEPYIWIPEHLYDLVFNETDNLAVADVYIKHCGE